MASCTSANKAAGLTAVCQHQTFLSRGMRIGGWGKGVVDTALAAPTNKKVCAGVTPDCHAVTLCTSQWLSDLEHFGLVTLQLCNRMHAAQMCLSLSLILHCTTSLALLLPYVLCVSHSAAGLATGLPLSHVATRVQGGVSQLGWLFSTTNCQPTYMHAAPAHVL